MKRRTFIKTGGLIGLPVLMSSLAACKKTIQPKKPDTSPLVATYGSAVDINPPPQVVEDGVISNGYLKGHSFFPADMCLLYVSAKAIHLDKAINVYDINGFVIFIIPFIKIYQQIVNPNAPYQNGFDYKDGIEFQIPPSLKSGVYMIANKIPMIVKNSNQTVDFTVVYCSNRENAYCNSGGRSLYSDPVAKEVSFLRPVPLSFFSTGFLKWLDKQAYTYNMVADIDLDDPANFKGNLLVVPGHSEYWTRKARNNFDKFVDDGKDVALLSGNTMWWQVRYSDQFDKLICYRTPSEDPDPNSLNKTILWTDKQLKYSIVSSIGADWDGGGYGVRYLDDGGWDGYKIQNPKSPLFEGLDLKKGDIINNPTHEHDGAPLLGFDSEGFPILNTKLLNFYKIELIGYDRGYRPPGKTVPTAIVFKKTATSGVIANMASTNWCTEDNFIKNNPGQLQGITRNIIDKFLQGKTLFSS